MALEFRYRGRGTDSAAIFPGAWNPPTLAHLAMAEGALRHAAEVVWVIPRAFPHKSFAGADLENRIRMLEAIAREHEGFSVAISDAGLYIDIADEAAAALGPAVDISLLCGRDAAERIASWDYGRPGVFEELLARYRLLVAARAGAFEIPPPHSGRILALQLPQSFNEVSSTEIRRRIAAGEPWKHLTPPAVAGIAEAVYTGPGLTF